MLQWTALDNWTSFARDRGQIRSRTMKFHLFRHTRIPSVNCAWICCIWAVSYALLNREQELHESWWELRSESLHKSFLNSHAPVKREQELHESNWWELRSESLHESLHESFLNSHGLVKREQELHESWNSSESCNIHQISSSFEQGLLHVMKGVIWAQHWIHPVLCSWNLKFKLALK
jgi:hypothetical protein